jgi:hypothetical protein
MHTLKKVSLYIVLITLISAFYTSISVARTNMQGRLDPLKLDWWTVDAGGGRLSVENYTLEGTIGQPDAATVRNGTYVLEGGFWSGGLQKSLLYLPTVMNH